MYGRAVSVQGTHTGGIQNPSLAMGPCVASGNFSRYWVCQSEVGKLNDNFTFTFQYIDYIHSQNERLRPVNVV